jgi:transposase
LIVSGFFIYPTISPTIFYSHSSQLKVFCLRFYEGVPATILCDNLKTVVIRSNHYEPVFTDLCYQLSEHYGNTFSAIRHYSPKDNAMVEQSVRIVYAHVYAPLRTCEFTSLKVLNEAMHRHLLLQ